MYKRLCEADLSATHGQGQCSGTAGEHAHRRPGGPSAQTYEEDCRRIHQQLATRPEVDERLS